MAFKTIFDSTTGEVIGTILVPDDDVASNLEAGQAAKTATSLVSSVDEYIADPGGAQTVTTRPAMTCVIPEIVAPGADLYITNVPDGAVVTIASTGSGGGTHTKSGGTGTLDAAVTGSSDGDVLTVDIALWPYKGVSGEVLVTS